MSITIPTLSYELNTKVRKYREAKGYNQEEFAFLIGKDQKEVHAFEDLTSDSSYDINYANFYARILQKLPKDMFFINSFEEAYIKISAKKNITQKGIITYKGTGIFNKKTTEIESYSLPVNPDYNISTKDQQLILQILKNWLREGYFKDGVTGYQLYQSLIAKAECGEIELPNSFRPILVSRAIMTICNKRKKPKLLPHRKLPKTAEKWLLYKEDI